jgi:Fur family ferric uptake transcriptional regulator
MRVATKRKCQELLSSVGLRRTRQRTAVLSVLFGARKPRTAEQIAAKLVPAAPNKVTIYRVLECFLEVGLVHKAFLKERAWHFELARNCTQDRCHPHFTCRKCGATKCLIGVSAPLVKGLGKGFILQRQQIRLEGICPSCS